MKLISLIIGIGVLLMSGCFYNTHPRTIRWDRADTTQNQFMKDRYECIKGAYGTDNLCDAGLMLACMEARGYSLRSDGQLFATSPVNCYNHAPMAQRQYNPAAVGIIGAMGAFSQGANSAATIPLQPIQQPQPQNTTCRMIGQTLNCSSW